MAAIVAVLTLSGLVLAFLTVTLGSKDLTTRQTLDHELESAARDAVALAVAELWGPLEFGHRASDLTVWDVRAHLEQQGLANGSAMLSLLERTPFARVDDEPRLGRVAIERLDARRDDIGLVTRLTIRTQVRVQPLAADAAPATYAHEEVLELDRIRWDGLEFAMLANNLNCAFCHLEVDSAPRWHNRDTSLAGTFDRVRVGMLERFQTRTSTENSTIAGTLYLGHGGVFSNGTPIVDWGRLDLDSVRFDSTGKLLESTTNFASDGSHGLEERNFLAADLAQPEPFENLYLGYLDPSNQVDGSMPSSFPQVFADDGGVDVATGMPVGVGANNRVVDQAEFDAAVVGLDGRLTAGHIHVVAPGNTLSSSAALTNALSNSNQASIEHTTQGAVVLVGTQDDPIVIEGDIAIDGDLVITGWVRGEGSLRVRGNIYVPSDLQYLDGEEGDSGARTYGLDAGGLSNGLGLAAGGSIVVGNQFSPLWGNGHTTGDTDGSFNFVVMELAAFNQLEWLKTREFLPGASGDVRDPSTYTIPNPNYAGADYVPRYYRFGADTVVPLMIGSGHFDPAQQAWIGPEHATSWTSNAVVLADPSNPTDPWLSTAAAGVAIHDLDGTGGWIERPLLEELAEHFLAQRARWKPLTVDAALYSGNSIFGISSSRVMGLSGRMTVNGAIVAADIGLLAPAGLRVNYDPRSAGLLDIYDHTRVGLRRVLSTPIGVD